MMLNLRKLSSTRQPTKLACMIKASCILIKLFKSKLKPKRGNEKTA